MIVRLDAATLSMMAQAIIASFDAGTGPATLVFYTGPQPSSVSVAVTSQTLLGTLTFSDPCGTELNGTITFNPIAQDNAADAAGIAVWARVYDSDGVARADFDVGDEASEAVIKMNTTTVVEGGPILISSFTLTVGG